MVDVMGHFGMALLFTVPAWFIWRRRGALAFVALALLTAPLPDIDLYLRMVFPTVHHHGVTHTLLFTWLVSLGGGLAVAGVATPYLRSWLGGGLDRETTFVFATGAFAAGGTSHIFADMLSAPDIADPIEPFWPVLDSGVSFDVVYYDDPLVNAGLLAAMLLVHLVLYWTHGVQFVGRYRVSDDERPPDRADD